MRFIIYKSFNCSLSIQTGPHDVGPFAYFLYQSNRYPIKLTLSVLYRVFHYNRWMVRDTKKA